MSAKLEEGLYKDRFAFQADFKLMVANAKLYNMVDSYVHIEAIALEIFFEKRAYFPSASSFIPDPFYRMDNHQQDS